MTTADRTIQGSSASSIGVTTYASSLATILPAGNQGNLVNQRDNSAVTGEVCWNATQERVYMPAKKFNHSRIFADL